jgi:hypothetical protein
MLFDEFHQKAWSDHANAAAEVAARFPGALKLVEKPEQVPLFARLVAHVDGEHLGRWAEGLSLLGRLRELPFIDAMGLDAIDRFQRSLRLCAGEKAALDGLSSSQRARVLAVAGPAIATQGQVQRGEEFFREAASLVRTLPKDDPAQRDLAVAGNNLAVGYETKPDRTPEETGFMIFGAAVGRHQWEIAGTALHVMRAEYRLAVSFAVAGRGDEAVKHAEKALELGAIQRAGDLDLFFNYEALARAERARGKRDAFAKAVERAKHAFARLEGGDREWCEPVLKALTDSL